MSLVLQNAHAHTRKVVAIGITLQELANKPREVSEVLTHSFRLKDYILCGLAAVESHHQYKRRCCETDVSAVSNIILRDDTRPAA